MVYVGKNVLIAHIGSSMLNFLNYTFKLNNVLCTPHIYLYIYKILFDSQFCKQNNMSIEFFPYMFLMEELSMRASLVHKT